jgi:hypothetical protein
MNLLFIGAFAFASFPALFLGVNNGATVLGVIVMAFAAVSILRSRA